jgi:hypothetical protein
MEIKYFSEMLVSTYKQIQTALQSRKPTSMYAEQSAILHTYSLSAPNTAANVRHVSVFECAFHAKIKI